MVRFAGMRYAIDPYATMGKRITRMELAGKLIVADREYDVAGWVPVSEEAKAAGGEPIYDLAARYLRSKKTITPRKPDMPKLEGVGNDPRLA
jgi:sulfur-oxidizing protein SoxB